MRANGSMLVLCFAAAGCGSSDALTWIGFPESDDAQSLVVAVRDGDVFLTAASTDDDRFETNIRLGEGPPYRTVHALLYDRSLPLLGYQPGQLQRAATAAEGELLRTPDRGVFATEVSPDTGSIRWRQQGSIPADLQSFRVRASAECAAFEAPTYNKELQGRVNVAVALDDEHVLVGATQDLFILSRDGRVDITHPELALARSAYVNLDRDEIWFGDSSGRIFRGTPSATTGADDVVLVAQTGFGPVFAMDGGIGRDGETEVYFASQLAEVGRVSGTTFTNLGSVTQLRNTMAWAEPGRAFIAAEGVDELFVANDSEVMPTEIGASSQIMSLARSERFGAIAGTAEGHFYTYRGMSSPWARAGGGGDFGWWGLASAAYEDGFVFLLASGFFGQYKLSRGYCESLPILQILEYGRLIPVGRDVVVVAIPDERPTTTVLYVPRN